jgi:hypothetical protein
MPVLDAVISFIAEIREVHKCQARCFDECLFDGFKCLLPIR